MDYSPPGFSVHGIFQARILKWVASSFSRGIFPIQRSEPCSYSVVKSPPAMQETLEMRVQSLGWEDPLEEGMATHSSILAWRIPMDRGA